MKEMHLQIVDIWYVLYEHSLSNDGEYIVAQDRYVRNNKEII